MCEAQNAKKIEEPTPNTLKLLGQVWERFTQSAKDHATVVRR